MELTFKKRNKNPKKRKINVYNGRKLIASAIPYHGWYACTMPIDEDIRKEIYEKFQSFGFSYVTLDLLGYRTGSMNETL